MKLTWCKGIVGEFGVVAEGKLLVGYAGTVKALMAYDILHYSREWMNVRQNTYVSEGAGGKLLCSRILQNPPCGFSRIN